MTIVLDRVRALVLRLAGEPVCDDCIAEKLDLSERQEAVHRTHELAGEPGFERSKDACALCGSTRPVTRSDRR